MGKLILVTGGCRSGKSSYAEQRSVEAGQKKLYLATAPVLDDEMRLRVDEHRRRRAGRGWDTVEEQTNLVRILQEDSPGYEVVLIDCLTLWINNILYQHELQHTHPDESAISHLSQELSAAARSSCATVICVTNEVGWGIVPENPAARLFRDLSGRCNQTVAAAADEVVLVVCGQPVFVKKPLA